jgi:NTE family protein
LEQHKVKRAIVIGGGGVLGGTWAVGALKALEETFGFRAAEADLLVGTSAGSVLTALVACGVSTDELVTHYNSEKVLSGPLLGYSWDPVRATGGDRPGSPSRWLPGSPGLLRAGLFGSGSGGRMPLTAVLSGLLPEGGKSLERVGHLVDAVAPLGGWVETEDGKELWIVAMDYQSGKRIVFGRSGSPVVSLADAVMASCAIPGWFTPIHIDGRTYVDGGAISATSVDVVAESGCDEIYVLAPMAATASDNPSGIGAKLERRWRGQVTKTAVDEIALVKSHGARVFFASPTPEDLNAIGANLMDASRRRNVLATSLRTSIATWESS